MHPSVRAQVAGPAACLPRSPSFFAALASLPSSLRPGRLRLPPPGKTLNPLLDVGQVEGGYLFGVGNVMMEEMLCVFSCLWVLRSSCNRDDNDNRYKVLFALPVVVTVFVSGHDQHRQQQVLRQRHSDQ